MTFECRDILEQNKDLIVETIAHAYETGLLDDPGYSSMLGTMFALLCESKIEGRMPENKIDGPIWKLTESYEEELRALGSSNVVAGPW